MGLLDFFKSFKTPGVWGGGLGMAGNGLGFTSSMMNLTGPSAPVDPGEDATAEEKSAYQRDLAAYKQHSAKTNAVAAAGNLAGAGGDIANIVGSARDQTPGSSKGTRTAGVLGGVSSLLGHLSSATGEGIMALQASGHLGGMSGDTAKKIKKWTEIGGGIFGALGSGINMFKSYRQYKNATKELTNDPDGSKKKALKRTMWRQMASSGFGILGGLAKIGANAATPGSGFQKAAAITGAVAQGGGTIMGGINMGKAIQGAQTAPQNSGGGAAQPPVVVGDDAE